MAAPNPKKKIAFGKKKDTREDDTEQTTQGVADLTLNADEDAAHPNPAGAAGPADATTSWFDPDNIPAFMKAEYKCKPDFSAPRQAAASSQASTKKSSAWAVQHSSADQGWRTPPEVFGPLNTEFGFVLDAAATKDNALCPKFITKKMNTLTTPWDHDGTGNLRGKAVWLNPPYNRQVGKFVQRAYEQSRACGATVVVLVMACTDTQWWKDWAWKAEEVRFVTGRIKFLDSKTGKPGNAAPKGSAVLVFTPKYRRNQPKKVILMDF